MPGSQSSSCLTSCQYASTLASPVTRARDILSVTENFQRVTAPLYKQPTEVFATTFWSIWTSRDSNSPPSSDAATLPTYLIEVLFFLAPDLMVRFGNVDACTVGVRDVLDGSGEGVGLDSPASSAGLSLNLDDSEWRRFLLPTREACVDGNDWLSHIYPQDRRQLCFLIVGDQRCETIFLPLFV